MKTQLLFIFAALFTFSSYSQVSFEKGYYIDDVNVKTECLIKNLDWNNNPTEFEYKLSEEADSKTNTIASVQEFGIYNNSKYVRSTVNIERSTAVTNKLGNERRAIFYEETLFLNVLVEGKAILYTYEEIGLVRYFFSVNGSKIEQLVYIVYITEDNHQSGENNQYKQQLLATLECSEITLKDVENLKYKRKNLVNIFADYNNCNNSSTTNFAEKRKRDLINLTLRPRINSSSLTSDVPLLDSDEIQFENQLGFGFGVELEYILPFNNNKWSISIEPTYQSYNSKGSNNYSNVSDGILNAEINYKSLEIPITARHYFFLNDTSKMFVSLGFLYDISSDSTIDFTRADGSNFRTFDVNTGSSYTLGVGYKYRDTYSIEIRYQTDRPVLTQVPALDSGFHSLSMIFGYSIF
jgi:hypothetical protein